MKAEVTYANTRIGVLSTLRVELGGLQVRHACEVGRHSKEYLIDLLKLDKARYILGGYQYPEDDVKVFKL